MSQTEPEAGSDMPDEQLDRAIEELRGVLKEEQRRPEAASRAGAGANSSIIMNIPVEVQIVLGSTEMPVSELMALQKGSTAASASRSTSWSTAAVSHAVKSRCSTTTPRASASG